MKNILAAYWGKRDDISGLRHPLLAHMLDAAAVLEQMLSLHCLKARWQACCGFSPSEVLVQRLCVLAALHDLGKLATGFQLRSENFPYPCNHLDSLYGLDKRLFGNAFQKFLAHAAVDLRLVGGWITAVFSHHGRTVNGRGGTLARPELCWQAHASLEPVAAMNALATELEVHFPLAFQKAASPQDMLPEQPTAQHLLAGLVMLADWIASDRDFFPFCGENGRPDAAQDPWSFARTAAREAVQRIGLDSNSARSCVCPPLQTQFPHISKPRPIQSAVDSLDISSGGSLLFLEAETGNGKTEAALRHFSRLFFAGAVDGLYFANPLRFAARQLHGRVVDFSQRTFGTALSTVLAIPGYVRMDAIEGRHLPDYSVIWSDASLGKRGWAAEHPKRFLCAPLGVGTIDQALLATLLVPHAQLRAAVLQRSLLVVDEVHASDAYMSQTLCSLLSLYGRVGGHVLLMSATLGTWARERYVAAWKGERFQETRIPPLEKSSSLPYPRLERLGRTAQEPWQSTVITPPHSDACKVVHMHCAPSITKPEDVARLALTAVEKGGCVLVLRNTVRQARLTMTALVRMAPAARLFQVNGHAVSHHSRYAAEDRQALDAAVEAHFGKQGHRPPVILVSTQTLEQSLDVDFDVLITDLCPADVLLQRIGRLHRHTRANRAIVTAHCHILVPEAGESWLLSPTARTYGFGEGRAYEDVLGLVQTWRMAEDCTHWQLPGDNRRLVEQATHRVFLQQLATSLGKTWEKADMDFCGRNYARSGQASTVCLNWDAAFDAPNNIISRESAAGVNTRLGLNDILVRFAAPVRSPLGHTITQVRVPGWLLRDDDAAAAREPVVVEEHTQYLHFHCGETSLFYTTLGLLTAKEWEEMCTMS